MAKTGSNGFSKIRILTRTPFHTKILNPNLNRKIFRLFLNKSLIYIDLLSLILWPLGEKQSYFKSTPIGSICKSSYPFTLWAMHTAFLYYPYSYYSSHDFSELERRRNIVQTSLNGKLDLVGRKLGYFQKFEIVRKRGSKFEKFEFLKMCLYYLNYRIHFSRVYSP